MRCAFENKKLDAMARERKRGHWAKEGGVGLGWVGQVFQNFFKSSLNYKFTLTLDGLNLKK